MLGRVMKTLFLLLYKTFYSDWFFCINYTFMQKFVILTD